MKIYEKYVYLYHRLKPSILLSAFDALAATAMRCNVNIILRRYKMNLIVYNLRCVEMYRCHVYIFSGITS